MSVKIEDELFLDRFRIADEAHIRIIDGAVCETRCTGQPCLYFCPANVYRLENGRIGVAWEGCVECGSCRVACPHLNIEWRFPTGGYGVSLRFG